MKNKAKTFKRQAVLLTSILALYFLFFSSGLFGKETIINFENLPIKAQTYIKTHFLELKPVKIEKETEGFLIKYEVELENGFDLDFTSKGEIIKIDGNSKLPDSVIPEKILEYVKKNYPDNYITDWSLEKKSQEVELDNNIELKFDLSGVFLRIDK